MHDLAQAGFAEHSRARVLPDLSLLHVCSRIAQQVYWPYHVLVTSCCNVPDQADVSDHIRQASAYTEARHAACMLSMRQVAIMLT